MTSRRPPKPRDDFIPTRESLLGRLKRLDDHKSWGAFFDVYWRLIYSSAVDAGLRPVEAEDVVQETVISVAHAMPGFTYDSKRGSFKGWLLQITAWRIKDQFRKRSRLEMESLCESAGRQDRAGKGTEMSDGSDTDLASESEAERMAAPSRLEEIWNREWESSLLAAAIERVKKRIEPRVFQLFDLSVLQERSLLDIRTALGVSAGRVYLARFRVSRLVSQELRKIKAVL